jgi:hypothetical protein
VILYEFEASIRYGLPLFILTCCVQLVGGWLVWVFQICVVDGLFVFSWFNAAFVIFDDNFFI